MIWEMRGVCSYSCFLLGDNRPCLLRVDVAAVGIRACGIELIRVGAARAN